MCGTLPTLASARRTCPAMMVPSISATSVAALSRLRGANGFYQCCEWQGNNRGEYQTYIKETCSWAKATGTVASSKPLLCWFSFYMRVRPRGKAEAVILARSNSNAKSSKKVAGGMESSTSTWGTFIYSPNGNVMSIAL